LPETDEGHGENKLNQPKFNLLNPSDKTRGSNYSDYDGTKEKCKKYKWWIIGGSVIVVLCIVLGVLLGTHEIGPKPTPPGPGPTPPLPPW
jgi:hypothetical protein